ncbi:MAG: HVO_0476 family zinc finger protein [Candidatus Thermoplasmatota archaeon]|nr:HVO_0476 family zinc finger protein [Candidatus Thermoplasmatota archaeon]
MIEGTVIFTYCDTCEDETAHRILRGRKGATPESGFEGAVQCIECRTIHNARFPVERPVRINCIISEGDSSRKTMIEFGPLEEVKIDDEIFWEDHNLKVASIESNGKRVPKAMAKEIDTVWMIVFDSVQVKVSIVKGENTKSEKLDVAPEEEFAVGDILEFGRNKVVINKIKTSRSMVYREGSPVEARNIKRVYSKIIIERREKRY